MAKITLVGVPPNWLNRSMHWAMLSRQKSEWTDRVRREGLRLPKEDRSATSESRHTVKVTYYYCGTPKDHEGAVAAAKPLIDALQAFRRVKFGKSFIELPGLRLIWADDLAHIGQPQYEQVPVAHRQLAKTVIEIERREP